MARITKNTYQLHEFILPKVSVYGYGPIEKEVKKFGRTGGSSGVIYVPVRFVGKKFKVLLLPLETNDEERSELNIE